MELFTRSFDPNWNRIVDLYVTKGTTVSPYISDQNTYKIVILEKGELKLHTSNETCEMKAPMFLLLSHREELHAEIVKSAEITTIFLKPSVIRDEFTLSRIDTGEFENCCGQTIYQDYLLIQSFTNVEALELRIHDLTLPALTKMKGLASAIEKELTQQSDGFWPCRSRSYIMELLYFINYSLMQQGGLGQGNTQQENDLAKVIEFFHEHINEPVTLEQLTKEFSLNRNKLNELFLKETSMTCLNYFMRLRIDLAKIMLMETELPVGEIGARVGFHDSNYFTKVFKKQVDMTPSEYRKNA